MREQDVWSKSSYSATSNACVEVAVTSQSVGVRDTKDREGGALTFDPRRWSDFLGMLGRS
ncbi:hypothetical protein J2S53_003462 [Actinopolyspora lacussalsi]|nr:DUF397 domain-containing protein [Actinopolyspora righensis]MDP9643517.1 hypothetical protein [Actinopolyspora lacussalsi]